jgi:ATP-dependent exoDNAse (exonuclease V) alpha subunit
MVAVTHVAVANLEDDGAMTLARFLYMYGRGIRNRPDCLVIDEISLVDCYLFTRLATLIHHAGCSVICAGDWAQLPPVVNVYLGFVAPSMRDRPWLKERCGYKRLTMTECLRSDARLFQLYSGIVRNPQIPLRELVRAARREFPAIAGPSPINLVCSHSRRIALNAELQDMFRPRDAIFVNPERNVARKNKPQGMWLWEGQELICATRAAGFRNQWKYRVLELTTTHAVLEAEGGASHKVGPLSRVAELFRLPFARTYHSSQGLGFDRVRLWDCESTYFSVSHLVTGMSRCRRSDALDFGAFH